MGGKDQSAQASGMICIFSSIEVGNVLIYSGMAMYSTMGDDGNEKRIDVCLFTFALTMNIFSNDPL